MFIPRHVTTTVSSSLIVRLRLSRGEIKSGL